VAEVIEQITGEKPDDDLVDLVTARLRAASEDDEALDLAAFLREHESWMQEWQ
jgi:pheromone shutdown protein TraB